MLALVLYKAFQYTSVYNYNIQIKKYIHICDNVLVVVNKYSYYGKPFDIVSNCQFYPKIFPYQNIHFHCKI